MDRFVRVFRLRRLRILALLHVFVVNAAGDCQRPQATETFVLGTDALLLNQFPEGIQVSLQCANGYDRISGSGSTVCSNGQWSKPDLFCKKKDCGQPKAKPNMKFHISKGTQFRAIIGVSCDEGYTLRGSSYQQCLATGWILANSRCQIVTCDRPGDVTNGNSSWTSEELPKYGETVQYTCNEGFTLVGKENITCTKNGKFDSQPPKCQDAVPTVLVPVSSTSVPVSSTSPPAEASTKSSAPTDSTTTTGTATSVSYSARGDLRYLKTEAGTSAVSVSSTTGKTCPDSNTGLNTEVVHTNEHTVCIAVLFVLLCILLAFLILGVCVFKSFMRRKGSYDTREDLKPELSHFHSL